MKPEISIIRSLSLFNTELTYSLSVSISAMLLTLCCPMLWRSVFNLCSALNDRSAEQDVAGITTRICTHVSQSTKYFLVISIEPNLKLWKHLIEGHIVQCNCNAVVRFQCQLHLALRVFTYKGLNAARCLVCGCHGMVSRNSNGEFVSHCLIFRPIAGTICHTLLKLSTLRYQRRIWMVMLASLQAEVTSISISAQTTFVA